jgi:hypothetical protein
MAMFRNLALSASQRANPFHSQRQAQQPVAPPVQGPTSNAAMAASVIPAYRQGQLRPSVMPRQGAPATPVQGQNAPQARGIMDLEPEGGGGGDGDLRGLLMQLLQRLQSGGQR